LKTTKLLPNEYVENVFFSLKKIRYSRSMCSVQIRKQDKHLNNNMILLWFISYSQRLISKKTIRTFR